MSDNEQNQKQAKSAKDALNRVQGQLKEAKRKAFEATLKGKAEELNATEALLRKKTAEIEELLAENSYLYE